MKTLIIHIGWHKTATSFIQLYFDRYRNDLLHHSVCYPRLDIRKMLKEIKHSFLYLAVLKTLEIDHLQKDLEVLSFDELFDLSLKEMANAGCRWTIISEEGLSEPYPGMAKLMARYREHFDEIKIVAFLRRQDLFLESLYAQFVKQKPIRSTLTFTEFIADPQVRKRADYGAILEWWEAAFGRENVLVRPFEQQSIKPDPLTCFFKLGGLPNSLLDTFAAEKEKQHATPSKEITEFFRHLNLRGIAYFNSSLIDCFKKSGVVLTDTKYFSSDDRHRIMKEYERSNAEVAQKYLNRNDGVLFHEPIQESENCTETWNGLSPLAVLEHALPVAGRMSDEIALLKRDLSRLEHQNKRLQIENAELKNENQRIADIRKAVYRFLRNRYRIIKKKGA